MKTRCLLPVLAAFLAFAQGVPAQSSRFYPLEVYVDAGTERLAAYQFELTYPAEDVAIVGIEGGARPFVEAPYYDPRGLSAGRVVIASFTLDERPPSGRVLVARVHLMDKNQAGTGVAARLIVAAGPDGRKIAARIETVSLSLQGEGE